MFTNNQNKKLQKQYQQESSKIAKNVENVNKVQIILINKQNTYTDTIT